ncbi:MAG TPA: heme ABC transporter ATP-binding protein [Phototrophicaceae bacterium]|nr:heme ABC transporter ATP-binding protein [Phototrophicaceae bacterium]
MLEGRGLTYRIGAQALVEDVSLTVTPGEIVAIVGANGAGKSTLLKLLCGDLRPERGSVLLEGQPIHQWSKRDLARRRAVLPQSSALGFGFSALEVVLMGRSPHVQGIERPVDYAIARAALAAARVDHLAERSYLTLSGGEQQRVQLARVLAQIWEDTGARYLLLDEPTNNLDLTHQHGTLAIATDFARRGVGVLTILHDLNLAAQYADHVLVLKAGRVLADDRPNAVFTPALIREAFDIAVTVVPHPSLDCPLIIAEPQNSFIKEI